MLRRKKSMRGALRRPMMSNASMHAPRSSRWTGLFRPRWVRILRIVLLVYVGWCAVLFLQQDALVFMPTLAGPGLSEARIAEERDIERMWVTHDDSIKTEAWLLRTTSTPAQGLVCFLHGNAELIDDALQDARAWNDRAMDVLLVEYRGYGRSAGAPSQDAIVTDVVDAFVAIRATTTYSTILLHGRSLGTGVAAQVARRLESRASTRGTLDALVLESPFTSIASFASRYGVPSFIVTNPFRTDEVLPTLTCPILLLHSRLDEIVPLAHSHTLATLNARAQLVELEGSHNSGLSRTNEYWHAIDAFVAELVEHARITPRSSL